MELVRCREPGPPSMGRVSGPKFHPTAPKGHGEHGRWSIPSPAQKGAPVSVGVVAGSLGSRPNLLRGGNHGLHAGVLPATVVTAGGHSSAPCTLAPAPPTQALQKAQGSLPGMCGLLCLRENGCFHPLLRGHRGLRSPGEMLVPSEWPSLLWSGAPGTN